MDSRKPAVKLRIAISALRGGSASLAVERERFHVRRRTNLSHFIWHPAPRQQGFAQRKSNPFNFRDSGAEFISMAVSLRLTSEFANHAKDLACLLIF